MFRTDGDLSTAPNRSALRGTPDTYRRAARTFNPCPGQGLRIGASESAGGLRGHHRAMRDIPGAEERRRLREELFDPATFEQLECVGVRRGWSCIDAGAGRGSVAQWLARRVGPEGRVLAVDVDLELLRSIEEPLFEARRHDLGSDGRVGEGFDLVHSRFVLEHISRRDAVLSELVDQLRPGGWLVVQDAEFSATALTDVAAYAEAMATFERAMAAQGTDYRWTRQLPSAMARSA